MVAFRALPLIWLTTFTYVDFCNLAYGLVCRNGADISDYNLCTKKMHKPSCLAFLVEHTFSLSVVADNSKP